MRAVETLPSSSCFTVTVSATNRIQKNEWIRKQIRFRKGHDGGADQKPDREEGEGGRLALEQPRGIGERPEQIDAGNDGRRNAELGGHVHDVIVRAAR